jgi:hypothetical protein
MTVRLRLKDPRTSEFRAVSVAAESLDEAVAIVEAQEQRRTAYALSPEEFLALERKLREQRVLSGAERARYHTHIQSRPYRIEKARS